MMIPDVNISRLNYGYEAGDLVLNNLDLQLQAGTINCVVAPNGAGKSTLLALIAGMLSPSRGAVTVGGLDPLTDQGRAACQYLPDSTKATVLHALLQLSLPDSRGFEAECVLRCQLLNAVFNEDRYDPAVVHSRFHRVLAALDLSSAITRGRLVGSAGEQHAVLVAWTLCFAVPGTVLLLDDPFSDLDVTKVLALSDFISDLKDTNTTIIIATADRTKLSALCPYKVHYLVAGKVPHTGDSDAQYIRYGVAADASEVISNLSGCGISFYVTPPRTEGGACDVFWDAALPEALEKLQNVAGALGVAIHPRDASYLHIDAMLIRHDTKRVS